MSTITAEGFDDYELELVDSDLASWEAADRLVIASTDFDFNQAEEVEIVSVDGNMVKVKGNFCIYCIYFITFSHGFKFIVFLTGMKL